VQGIFDIKWSGGGGATGGADDERPVLGHAAADGYLYTYTLQARLQLEKAGGLDCRTNPDRVGALALSLDWNNRKPGVTLAADRCAAVSLSDGSIAVVSVGAGGRDLTKLVQWDAHEADLAGAPTPAWIVGFDCHQPSVLFTGADDRKLKGWDLRMGTDHPTFVRVSL
jgi:diphthamide biosynthesis protein 7